MLSKSLYEMQSNLKAVQEEYTFIAFKHVGKNNKGNAILNGTVDLHNSE